MLSPSHVIHLTLEGGVLHVWVYVLVVLSHGRLSYLTLPIINWDSFCEIWWQVLSNKV